MPGVSARGAGGTAALPEEEEGPVASVVVACQSDRMRIAEPHGCFYINWGIFLQVCFYNKSYTIISGLNT